MERVISVKEYLINIRKVEIVDFYYDFILRWYIALEYCVTFVYIDRRRAITLNHFLKISEIIFKEFRNK